MTEARTLTDTRRILLYFGPMTLLIFLAAPESILDVPTSYMLKNQLHAAAPQVSLFRLLTGIPIYLSFIFGLTRDMWSPLGLRDRGYLLVFAPLTAGILAWMAFGHLTYLGLLIGMMATMLAFRLIMAAYQGLMALVGQEALMAGRLSVLWNIFSYLPYLAAVFASGYMSEHLSPREIFLLAAALTLLLAAFGLWKPRAVFSHTYDQPQARHTTLRSDLKRLFRHRAIYPAALINFLWLFTPGISTPLQFFLTNHLHTPDATYANYFAIYLASFMPTFLLYGYLCTRMPQRRLLWWSAWVGLPQMIPLLFVNSGSMALLMAIPMGLMGGMGNAAYIDLAVRSCPSGLQGTFMMLISALLALAFRGSDLLGSWIYATSPTHGFLYCVIAMVTVYALILPLILLIPKQLTATADGEPNPLISAA